MSDSANALKAGGRIISFELCEIWFSGDRVVVDSRLPLPDLKLREFARPRIFFEDACYYVREKSQSSGKSAVYRYVLAPWPKHDESITRTIILNADYFRNRKAERQRTTLERLAFKALVVFYPFLGFLWSPQKRVLNRIGFETIAISSFSIYTGFITGFMCAVFLMVFELGAGTLAVQLLLGAVLFLIDATARFNRLLIGQDEVPPGFFEWLIRRKERYD